MAHLIDNETNHHVKPDTRLDLPNGDAVFTGIVWHDPNVCSGAYSRIAVTWVASGRREEMNAATIGCTVEGNPVRRAKQAA